MIKQYVLYNPVVVLDTSVLGSRIALALAYRDTYPWALSSSCCVTRVPLSQTIMGSTGSDFYLIVFHSTARN